MKISRKSLGMVAVASAATLVLVGCQAKADPADSADALTVSSTDSECAVSASDAASGILTFNVKNETSQISEFYLLAEDGLRIVGEVENIAPDAERTLTVTAQPGNYFTLCKPGMIGEGVGRTAFTVSGDRVEITGEDAEQKKQAVDLYAAFVKDQVGQLVPALEEFVTAYVSEDDETAKDLFATTRAYYERIEPVAEALGDLDPKIDYREVDAVAEGLDWTGFHRIEKDLWVPEKDALNADDETPAWQDWEPSTPEQRKEFGEQLTTDVAELYDHVHSEDFLAELEEQGIGNISNGAISLLDEVAGGKITGEEDWWSGTDLWDFAANVEGSKMAFDIVRDFVTAKGDDGAALVTEITEGYADLNEALAEFGSLEDGFVNYSELTDADKKSLTDLLNALAEPLSKLTSTLVS